MDYPLASPYQNLYGNVNNMDTMSTLDTLVTLENSLHIAQHKLPRNLPTRCMSIQGSQGINKPRCLPKGGHVVRVAIQILIGRG